MSTEYSGKEVRVVAEAVRVRAGYFHPIAAQMLAAFAERIEADERAVPVGVRLYEYCDAEIQLCIEYSHNYATARPDISPTAKEHVSGLCDRLESLLADRAAIAAQGQGEAAAKVTVRDDNGMPYIERMDHSLPVGTHELYLHTAPPASPAGVPDGMVLVSREPTPEMLAIYEHIRSGSDWQAHVFRLTKRQLNRHRAAYKAMIAAAAPSATPEGGEVDRG